MDWDQGQLQENDYINIHAIELTEGIWFHGKQGTPIGRRPIGYPIVLGVLLR